MDESDVSSSASGPAASQGAARTSQQTAFQGIPGRLFAGAAQARHHSPSGLLPLASICALPSSIEICHDHIPTDGVPSSWFSLVYFGALKDLRFAWRVTRLSLFTTLLRRPACCPPHRRQVTLSRERWMYICMQALGSDGAVETKLSLDSTPHTSSPILPWRDHDLHRADSSPSGLEPSFQPLLPLGMNLVVNPLRSEKLSMNGFSRYWP